MFNQKPLVLLPVLFLSVGFLAISFSLYKNVLPYKYSNQWEPTSAELNSSGEYDNSNETGEFLGKPVKSSDFTQQDHSENLSAVLGDNDSDDKRIEVDLSKQKVYAFEGKKKVMEFLISSGKWGKTPTGTFTIEYKTMAQKMSGGSKALGTYYYLPNVQFVQFFGNKEIPWSRGFSFHGTYWHNNFGRPMSHGCINMRNEDAKKLYEWTKPSRQNARTVKADKENPGTKVIIYGKPPK